MRSARDAFGQATAPEAFSLPLTVARASGQTAFAFDRPAVHHLPVAIESPEVRHGAIRERAPRGPTAASLVALLQARSLDEALEIAQALLEAVPRTVEERAFVEKAIAAAVGRDPLPARWGVDPVADWIRARLVDATGTGGSWLGILAWLGRHEGPWSGAREALDAMPLAAAALATTAGLRATLTRVTTILRQARRAKDWPDLLRVLLLRCALEGAFDAEWLRRGVVPTPRRGGDVVAAAWKPLLLARRALMDAGHVVGAAHLTAALVATDVRRGIMGSLRVRGLHARVPAWGSRSLDEKEAGELHAMLHGRSRRETLAAPPVSSAPWPPDWGGPDTEELTRRLGRLIESDGQVARDVFLHDGLSLAAVHALGGHTMNAMAALGASRTPGVLDEARIALSRAIHLGIRGSTLPEDLPSKQADAVYRQLRELPEPSLALETPHALLGSQRAEAQHALQTSGRLHEFRKLRLVLERPDVAQALGPFWLLRDGPELEPSLVALVRGTFARLQPPTADACGRFLRSIE